MSIGLAFRAFFAVLSNRELAAGVGELLAASGSKLTPPTAPTVSPTEPAGQLEHRSTLVAPRPNERARSDALTLLSTLQREARLLDLVLEPIDGYGDAEVGVAAREVLRDSRKTLSRLFDIQPLANEAEGQLYSLASSPSPARVRLTGAAHASSGTVVHRGWVAKQCELPSWNGSQADASILAPVEVEAEPS